MWEVKGRLLNAQPPQTLWTTPIICWKLSCTYPARTTRYFHKAMLTFTFSRPNPSCALHHWLPLSAHSVLQRNFFPLNIFQAAACLSVGVCARIYSWINVWFLLECQGCRHVNMCKVRYELCAINFWIPLLVQEHRKVKEACGQACGRHQGSTACLCILLVSHDTTALGRPCPLAWLRKKSRRVKLKCAHLDGWVRCVASTRLFVICV